MNNVISRLPDLTLPAGKNYIWLLQLKTKPIFIDMPQPSDLANSAASDLQDAAETASTLLSAIHEAAHREATGTKTPADFFESARTLCSLISNDLQLAQRATELQHAACQPDGPCRVNRLLALEAYCAPCALEPAQ